jgi:cytosine/adenosine deaminase-related metal-dependent hydrolase
LKETQRLVEAYDDKSRFSMLRVVVAPCSPFTVSRELMRQSVLLARSLGARMHTHLAENDHDVSYGLEKFGMTPVEYAESVGFMGDDVWHAHCVKLDAGSIAKFAATGTGVAHCPCSNMRLASGIAPVRKMLNAGVPVGLGVDGSASNDAGHLLNEARQAMLLARVGRAVEEPFGCDKGPGDMTARDALRLATRGGARVLGRDDIGCIAPGMAADLAIYDVTTLGFAGGAVHDPIASLALCASPNAAYTIVNGKVVVRQGELTTVPLRPLVEKHNKLAIALVNG